VLISNGTAPQRCESQVDLRHLPRVACEVGSDSADIVMHSAPRPTPRAV